MTQIIQPLVGGMVAFCCLAAMPSAFVRAEEPRPNIVIIMADDMGYETIGAYGGLDFETPQLDRMAAEGVRFSRMYTSPVCTPSRMTLHTSLYADEHGYTGVLPVHNGTTEKVDFENEFGTFAQQFRAAGYHTATTGKWQLATLCKHPNHLQTAGFESWCIWQIWDCATNSKTVRYWNPFLNRDGSKVPATSDDFGPDILRDYVIEKLQAAAEPGSPPVMILHNMLLPHTPIIDTPDDRTAGRSGDLYSMVNYLDKLVGSILDEIERLGIKDNTYVLFLGDNGTYNQEGLNDGGIRHTEDGPVAEGKWDPVHGGCHVPLIIWGPDSMAPAGTVVDDLVDMTDIYPTVCSLAGVPLPEDRPIRGRSIQPQLEGRNGLPRNLTHGGVNSELTIFDGQWRLNEDGTLRDSRNLPYETVVPPGDPEGDAARARLQLLDESRSLSIEPGASEAGVIDDADTAAVTVSGDWVEQSAVAGYFGSGYRITGDPVPTGVAPVDGFGSTEPATDQLGNLTSITVGSQTYSTLVEGTLSAVTDGERLKITSIAGFPADAAEAIGGSKLDTGALNSEFTVQFGQTVANGDRFYLFESNGSTSSSGSNDVTLQALDGSGNDVGTPFAIDDISLLPGNPAVGERTWDRSSGGQLSGRPVGSVTWSLAEMGLDESDNVTGFRLSSSNLDPVAVGLAKPDALPGPTGDPATYAFHYTIPADGDYTIDLRWTDGVDRASNVAVTLEGAEAPMNYTVDQRINGGVWNTLDTVTLTSGTELTATLSAEGADGAVVADAVRVTQGGSGSIRFSDWQAAYFSMAELGDPGLEATLWGAEADPDADFRANKLEYAQGGHPRIAEALHSSPGIRMEGQHICIDAIMRSSAPVGSVRVVASETLGQGSWVDPVDLSFSLENSHQLTPDFEERRYRDTSAPGALPRAFFRLEVE